MSLLATKQAIETVFSTEWTDTDIAWNNVEFDTKDKIEWVRFNFLPGDSNQASFGGQTNFYRSNNVVIIQIFVEPNSGAKRALELADTAIDILRSRHIENNVFYSPTVSTVGVNDGWYQINVICNFYTDNIL